MENYTISKVKQRHFKKFLLKRQKKNVKESVATLRPGDLEFDAIIMNNLECVAVYLNIIKLNFLFLKRYSVVLLRIIIRMHSF